MAKKLLCVAIIVLALVCTLASCGHEHNFDEWEITRSATCAAEGTKERYCSCGEKQTQSIAKLEHKYVNDTCSECGKVKTNTQSASSKEEKYNLACTMLSNGNYEEAYNLFSQLGDYNNSKQYLSRLHYIPTNLTYTSYDNTIETTAITLNEMGLPEKIEKTYNNQTDTYEYAYNSDGTIKKEIYTNTYGPRTYYYSYNNNKLIQKSEFYNGAQVSVTNYTYDSYGNLIREEIDQSYTSSVTTYTYNTINELVKKTIEYSSDRSYTYEYSYDVRGNKIEEIYSMDAQVLSITNYTYDAYNRMVSETMTNKSGITYPTGAVLTYNYTYDNDGNLIQEKQSMNGVVESTTDYVYGSAGQLLRCELSWIDDEDTTTWEYNYTVVYSIYVTEEDVQALIDRISSALW